MQVSGGEPVAERDGDRGDRPRQLLNRVHLLLQVVDLGLVGGRVEERDQVAGGLGGDGVPAEPERGQVLVLRPPVLDDLAVRPDLAVIPDLGVACPMQGFALGAAQKYPGNVRPVASAAADFDGDGLVDLALASNDGANVAVLRNLGCNRFAAPVTYPTDRGAPGLAAADLDGDGKIDLAVSGNTLSVLFNQGGGAFGPTTSYGVSGGHLVAADLDKDGRPDLAVAGGSVGVLLNRGNRKFAVPASWSVGGGAVALAPGDFDADGLVDLAVAASSGTKILFNQGGAMFPAVTPIDQASTAIASGDFTGDGKPDLAVALNAGVRMMLNPGNGQFNGGYVFPITRVTAIQAADLNADRNLDVVVAATTMNVILGGANGAFQNATAYLGPDVLDDYTFAIADLDGDTLPDLAFTEGDLYEDMVSVRLNRGAGRFDAPALPLLASSTQPVAGDFDLDGKLDLAVLQLGRVDVLRGLGNGGFGAPAGSTVTAASQAIATGDLDRDGKLDVVAVDPNGRVNLLLNQGGVLGPSQVYTVGAPGAPNAIAVGDVTDDGKPEVITTESQMSIASILHYVGGGAIFSYNVNNDRIILSSTRTSVVIADVNGDGHNDLVFSGDARVDVALSRGGGSFAPVATYAITDPTLTTGSCAAVGDLNHDGKPDIVAKGLTPNIFLNQGNGTFGAPTHGPRTGVNFGCPLLVDLDGDGNLDLIYGWMLVSLGKGDGTFGATYAYSVLGSWAAGDWNGDGRPDIAVSGGSVTGMIFNRTR